MMLHIVHTLYLNYSRLDNIETDGLLGVMRDGGALSPLLDRAPPISYINIQTMVCLLSCVTEVHQVPFCTEHRPFNASIFE